MSAAGESRRASVRRHSGYDPGCVKTPRRPIGPAAPGSAALPGDAGDLGAFEGEIVHQPLLIEDETDDRAGDGVGVDGTAGAHRDDGDRAVDAHSPAVRSLKLRKRRLGHEHDDHGPRLRAELKADRTGDDIVKPGGPATNVQRAFPVFAADAEAGLDDGWEDQNRHGLVRQLARRIDFPKEPRESRTYLRIDLGPRGSLGAGWRAQRR